MEKPCIVSNSEEENVLVHVLDKIGIPSARISWKEFVSVTPKDFSCYLIVSDMYPEYHELLPDEQSKINQITSQGIPVFCEFLPVSGLVSDSILTMPFTRLVYVGDDPILSSGIPMLSLFETHQAPFLDVAPDIDQDHINPQIVLARVAGSHRAELGLPTGKKAFEIKNIFFKKGTLLISTVKISNFKKMQFRPKYLWLKLVINILTCLLEKTRFREKLHEHTKSINTLINKLGLINTSLPLLQSTGPVVPLIQVESLLKTPSKIVNIYATALKSNGLGADHQGSFLLDDERREKYRNAIKRALDWFRVSNMLLDDGRMGVREGFGTSFNPDGTKPVNEMQRADCTTDTAFAFLLAGMLPPGGGITNAWLQAAHVTGNNLFEVCQSVWQFCDNSIRRGLFAWSWHPYAYNVFYSDDNGRCIYEHLFAGLFLGFNKTKATAINLIKRGLMGVIGLKQTWGKTGHRWRRIDLKDLWNHGGRAGQRRWKTKVGKFGSPHYESNSQAAALAGAEMVGDIDLFKLIARGIDDYMKRLNKVKVEHSFNDDFSKFLLALAFLVHGAGTFQKEILASVTARYEGYLHQIVAIFGCIQDSCGAVPERDLTRGKKFSENKNEQYGTGEVSVYTSRDDCITDQLYSTSFLAVSLYFAWKTGKCPEAWPILLNLLDYLCAIQYKSHSPVDEQLDGCWMRGFDYSIGEYFGANGDVGWGTYSVETGWMVAVIVSALEMVLLDLDPWVSIPMDIQEEIKDYYTHELKRQISLENDWKTNTPRAFKSMEEADKFVKNHPGEWKWDPQRDWTCWGPDW